MKKSRRRAARMNIKHYSVLVTRYFRQIFTNFGTLMSLVLQAPVMLLIVSLVYQSNAFVEVEKIGNANMTLFVLVFMSALMGILNSYREICKERDILGREVYGGLDMTSYVMSKLTVLAAVGLFQNLILVFGSMAFIDFNMVHRVAGVFVYLAAMFLVNVSVASLGLFISALLKKSESAILPVLLIIIMQVVFSGVVVPLEGAAEYFNYITPTMWGSSVLGREFQINRVPELYHHDCYDYSSLACLAVLALFTVLFTVLTVIRLTRLYTTKD